VSPSIRLLLADVDGTLVTQDKELTERAVDAVHRLHRADILFAITSGRPPRGMEMLFDPLDLTTPIAAFNGGLLVERDLSVLEEKLVPEHVVGPVLELMTDAGLVPWLYRGTEWLVLDEDGPHVDREAATVEFEPTVVDSYDDLHHGVAKIVGVSDDRQAMDGATDRVVDRFGDHVSAAQSQPYYLDVTHPHANKGTVATSLAHRLQVPKAQIATIGDMPNDVLMFARSGLSIAMGNASPEVQGKADQVTASNQEEGFAEAVERFILPEG
jgi:Cof subfamily protein (haloacid dehalogenase superfamily)